MTTPITGSPAYRLGMQAGDVIVEFNGIAVNKADELGWMTSTAGVGSDAVAQVLGLVAIRSGRRELHKRLMVSAFAASFCNSATTFSLPGRIS